MTDALPNLRSLVQGAFGAVPDATGISVSVRSDGVVVAATVGGGRIPVAAPIDFDALWIELGIPLEGIQDVRDWVGVTSVCDRRFRVTVSVTHPAETQQATTTEEDELAEILHPGSGA